MAPKQIFAYAEGDEEQLIREYDYKIIGKQYVDINNAIGIHSIIAFGSSTNQFFYKLRLYEC